MAAPVPLFWDFDAAGLRILARGARDPAQIHRPLASSAIYAGMPPQYREQEPSTPSIENLWQFMRDNSLGNRVFQSYADILNQ